MSDSIKFVIEYEQPFWRKDEYSGMLYSYAGIVIGMYDHTNIQGDGYRFIGFLNSGASGFSSDVRREFVLTQLAELFGPMILEPIIYLDKMWNGDNN